MTGPAPNIVPLRPHARKALGDGLYLYPKTGRFYGKVTVGPRRESFRALKARTERRAREELAALREKYRLGENPFQVAVHTRTVGDLIEFYRTAGCPYRTGIARTGTALKHDLARLKNLEAFWKHRAVATISHMDCDEYHRWRIKRLKREASGNRTVDVELVTLSNAFRHAVRNRRLTGIESNPIREDRRRYQPVGAVVHCRDFKPRSAESIHAVARYCFEARRSQSIGWALLFQFFTGQRHSEILSLRMEAEEGAPGHVRYAADGKPEELHLYRSTTHKGTYPRAVMHPALQVLILAHRKWHRTRYDRKNPSPWYFPGRKPSKPLEKTSVQKTLTRLCKVLELEEIHTHGLRAAWVDIWRAAGKDDAWIALRAGHKSATMIVNVYGDFPDRTLTFMPAGAPAWCGLSD